MTSTNRTTSAGGPAPSRKVPLGLILGGVFTVLLIVTVFLTLGDEEAAAGEFGDPVVTGESLPVLVDPAADPAVGTAAPEVTGADFEGNPVAITDDGEAKIIVFLAHWCPVCQNEVPWATEWLESTDLPDGVAFYSVATSITPARDNYPPSSWLEREGWPAPVVVDDDADSVGSAFGLSAYPFWVAVDAGGTVFGRASGSLGPEVLDALVLSLTEASS